MKTQVDVQRTHPLKSSKSSKPVWQAAAAQEKAGIIKTEDSGSTRTYEEMAKVEHHFQQVKIELECTMKGSSCDNEDVTSDDT